MTKPPTTNERLATVETEVKNLRTTVENHVIHRLDRLDARLWWVLGLIAVAGMGAWFR